LTADTPPSPDTAGTPGVAGLLHLRRISSTDRRIVLVSAATVASRVFGKLAQLVFLVMAARLLSVEQFAGYSYLLVLAVTFSMLADTGVALAASREISAGRRTPAEIFWSSAPVIGLGAGLGGLAVLAFGLADSAPGSSGVALLLTCLFVAVNTCFNFAATTLRGVGRSIFEAVLQGGGALAFVGAAALALALGAGLVPVLAILVAKEALSAVVALGGLRHEIGRPQRWSPTLWRRLLRLGIQLGLASAALALVTRIPTFVLGNSGTTADLAWFSAAQRLADAVLLLATTGGFAVLPSLTLLLETEPDRAWRLLGRLLGAAGLAGVLLGALTVALASPIVTAAFGSDFSDAAAPTRVLMAGAPAYAVVGIGWFALIALGRERRLLQLAAASTVLSLVLSIALVPDGGDVGGAIAYAAALGFLAAGMLMSLARIRP
jgi:O-antigen/teichoic acid export membrane protein